MDSGMGGGLGLLRRIRSILSGVSGLYWFLRVSFVLDTSCYFGL